MTSQNALPPARHFGHQSLILRQNKYQPVDTKAGGWRLLTGVDSIGVGGVGAGSGARGEYVLTVWYLVVC